MSKVKMFVPEAYVFGSSIVLDKDINGRTVPVIAVETMKQAGHGDTPYVCRGAPLWRKPKPTMLAQHWKNEAARRECGDDISKASPKHLRIVAVYRAMPARIANELRALKRRMNRKQKLAA